MYIASQILMYKNKRIETLFTESFVPVQMFHWFFETEVHWPAHLSNAHYPLLRTVRLHWDQVSPLSLV